MRQRHAKNTVFAEFTSKRPTPYPEPILPLEEKGVQFLFCVS